MSNSELAPFEESALRGYCSALIGDVKLNDQPCSLSLSDGSLDIQTGPPLSAYIGSIGLDSDVKISELVLFTPNGRAQTKDISFGTITAIRPGSWSNSGTLGTALLLRRKTWASVTIRFQKVLSLYFDERVLGSETLFSPGLDTSGLVEVSKTLSFVGDKETVSVFDDDRQKLRLVRTAISIATGAPVHVVATVQDKCFSIYNLAPRTHVKSRVLFFEGYPFAVPDKRQAGLSEVFNCVLSYMKRLSESEQEKFSYAVDGLLQGRMSDHNTLYKLVSGLHFLEWFDGSKTMSANQLASRLKIERAEADILVSLRNEIIHNHIKPTDVIRSIHERLVSLAPPKFLRLRAMKNEEVALVDYLYSLLTEALLHEIGFSGLHQHYLPVDVTKGPS